mgnify:CR=1 FL=1
MHGLIDYDPQLSQATLGAGTLLHDLGIVLHGVGLGMQNLGDVDTQTIAGVICTGTHGSGRKLQNLSASLIGARLVAGTGEILEWSLERQPDLVRAARVSLGLLGIFTAVRLQLRPAYQLRRREYSVGTDDCLAHLDELADTHRNCDFYWYPRRDEVKLRTLNPPDIEPPSLPYARCIKDEVGFSHEIITRERKLKFEELEYLVPAQAGPACFQEVRRRILDHHRQHVAWRVLYRFVAADDAYLSPAHDRDSVAISVHQNASLPYQDYFDDIEPILRSHGGRPHWAKRHSLHGEALAQLAQLAQEQEAQKGALRRLDTIEEERTNPNGSGISIGHPVGATGAILNALFAAVGATAGSAAPLASEPPLAAEPPPAAEPPARGWSSGTRPRAAPCQTRRSGRLAGR